MFSNLPFKAAVRASALIAIFWEKPITLISSIPIHPEEDQLVGRFDNGHLARQRALEAGHLLGHVKLDLLGKRLARPQVPRQRQSPDAHDYDARKHDCRFPHGRRSLSEIDAAGTPVGQRPLEVVLSDYLFFP